MPFDFPASPNVGDRTNNAGIWYQWSGVKWTAVATPNNYAPLGAINNDGRNLVHNPVFTVQQRGQGPWTSPGVYTADRWRTDLVTDTASFTLIAADDGMRSQIGDEACEWFLDNFFTGSGAAGAYTAINQQIENVHRLGGKTVTVSFYAWASPGALQLGVNFYQQFGAGTDPVTVSGQSVTVAGNSWARYSLTFQLPSTAGMTTDEGSVYDKTSLYFWYSASSTYAVDSGSVPVQSGRITLWGVQLEEGTVATPLDYGGTAQQQLANCQRFYVGDGFMWCAGYVGGTGTAVGQSIMLPVPMRATPSMTMDFTGSSNVEAGALYAQTNQSIYMNGVPPVAGGWILQAVFTASADL